VVTPCVDDADLASAAPVQATNVEVMMSMNTSGMRLSMVPPWWSALR
jgi:hypothetical protein